jgi:chromosome segregation ATPase
MPGHGHRVFIDVPSPPRSPRRAHYRRHSLTLDERPAYVFRDDLDMMQERENGLRVANDTLQRHNQILKGQLQGKEKTIRDQQAWIDQLEVENHELRRSLESNSDVDSRRETKIRDLRRKNTKLEAENDSLKMRVREVLRIAKEATDDRVRQLKDEVAEWRRRYEDQDRRIKRLRDNMDDHIAANERLTSENESLRRKLEVEERLRRRHGY